MPKNRDFAKGIIHGFCPKTEIFLFMLFGEMKSENIVF